MDVTSNKPMDDEASPPVSKPTGEYPDHLFGDNAPQRQTQMPDWPGEELMFASIAPTISAGSRLDDTLSPAGHCAYSPSSSTWEAGLKAIEDFDWSNTNKDGNVGSTHDEAVQDLPDIHVVPNPGPPYYEQTIEAHYNGRQQHHIVADAGFDIYAPSVSSNSALQELTSTLMAEESQVLDTALDAPCRISCSARKVTGLSSYDSVSSLSPYGYEQKTITDCIGHIAAIDLASSESTHCVTPAPQAEDDVYEPSVDKEELEAVGTGSVQVQQSSAEIPIVKSIEDASSTTVANKGATIVSTSSTECIPTSMTSRWHGLMSQGDVQDIASPSHTSAQETRGPAAVALHPPSEGSYRGSRGPGGLSTVKSEQARALSLSSNRGDCDDDTSRTDFQHRSRDRSQSHDTAMQQPLQPSHADDIGSSRTASPEVVDVSTMETSCAFSAESELDEDMEMHEAATQEASPSLSAENAPTLAPDEILPVSRESMCNPADSLASRKLSKLEKQEALFNSLDGNMSCLTNSYASIMAAAAAAVKNANAPLGLGKEAGSSMPRKRAKSVKLDSNASDTDEHVARTKKQKTNEVDTVSVGAVICEEHSSGSHKRYSHAREAAPDIDSQILVSANGWLDHASSVVEPAVSLGSYGMASQRDHFAPGKYSKAPRVAAPSLPVAGISDTDLEAGSKNEVDMEGHLSDVSATAPRDEHLPSCDLLAPHQEARIGPLDDLLVEQEDMRVGKLSTDNTLDTMGEGVSHAEQHREGSVFSPTHTSKVKPRVTMQSPVVETAEAGTEGKNNRARDQRTRAEAQLWGTEQLGVLHSNPPALIVLQDQEKHALLLAKRLEPRDLRGEQDVLEAQQSPSSSSDTNEKTKVLRSTEQHAYNPSYGKRQTRSDTTSENSSATSSTASHDTGASTKKKKKIGSTPPKEPLHTTPKENGQRKRKRKRKTDSPPAPPTTPSASSTPEPRNKYGFKPSKAPRVRPAAATPSRSKATSRARTTPSKAASGALGTGGTQGALAEQGRRQTRRKSALEEESRRVEERERNVKLRLRARGSAGGRGGGKE